MTGKSEGDQRRFERQLVASGLESGGGVRESWPVKDWPTEDLGGGEDWESALGSGESERNPMRRARVMGAGCQIGGRRDNDNSQKLVLMSLPRLRPHESMPRFKAGN